LENLLNGLTSLESSFITNNFIIIHALKNNLFFKCAARIVLLQSKYLSFHISSTKFTPLFIDIFQLFSCSACLENSFCIIFGLSELFLMLYLFHITHLIIYDLLETSDEIKNFIVFLTDHFNVSITDIEFDGLEFRKFKYKNW
jgi:hypothetical protein